MSKVLDGTLVTHHLSAMRDKETLFSFYENGQQTVKNKGIYQIR